MKRLGLRKGGGHGNVRDDPLIATTVEIGIESVLHSDLSMVAGERSWGTTTGTDHATRDVSELEKCRHPALLAVGADPPL
jgi:hypothetical protein